MRHSTEPHIDTRPFDCPSCGQETIAEDTRRVEVLGEEKHLCDGCAHSYDTLGRKLDRVGPRDTHVNVNPPKDATDRVREKVKITDVEDRLPEPVIELAAAIRAGHHPCRLDLDYNVSEKSADDEWVKLAACGNPTYVHQPSGYGVTLGEGNTAAIVKPSQLRPQALLTQAIEQEQLERLGEAHIWAMADDGHITDIAQEYDDHDSDQ